MGGWNAHGLKSVEFYNDSAWTTGHDLISPRYNLAAVVLSEQVFVLGGIQTVEVFSGGAWAATPALSSQRRLHAAVVFRSLSG